MSLEQVTKAEEVPLGLPEHSSPAHRSLSLVETKVNRLRLAYEIIIVVGLVSFPLFFYGASVFSMIRST